MTGRTRRQLLSEASEFLRTKGRQDARLSAEVLLANVLGVDRTALFRDDGETVTPGDEERFGRFVERRGNGEPTAYLTGEKEFYSLPFFVDPSVLIPRPESELLVEILLRKFGSRSSGRVIDVGTGSGAIAITLKKNLPRLDVSGSDVSAASLDVARRNAARHGVSVTWIRSDLLSGVEGTFDAIVANLPYIPAGDIEHLTVGVRDYEPHEALDGGADGLSLIGRMVREARQRLSRGGWLLLEVGNAQEEEVRKLLQTAGFTIESIRDDYQGIPRAVVARSD